MGFRGHLRTVGQLVARALAPATPPPWEEWSTTLVDPVTGTVRLSGRLSRPAGADRLVVMVHGLGGSRESGYLLEAARAAHSLGLASLRLSLRGADGAGGDFHHGGLTADLAATVADDAIRSFDRIAVLGYSLGGHIALRFATEVEEPRVAAVAAVCSPLDLDLCVRAIDRPLMAPYRAYLMRKLNANYRRLAGTASVPTPPEEVAAARTIREWDSLTVVPRFGFRDAGDYYAQASVGPRLGRLRRPTLLVAGRLDPMVPAATLEPSLAALADRPAAEPPLTVHWCEGAGHVAFPREVDLGVGEVSGIHGQVLRWLGARSADR